MKSKTFKMLGLFVITNVTMNLCAVGISELADTVRAYITVDSFKSSSPEQFEENILSALSKKHEMFPELPAERRAKFQEDAATQYKDMINVGDEITFFYFSRGISHKVSGKFYGKSPTSNTVIINSTYIPIVDLPPDVKAKMFPEFNALARTEYVNEQVEKWQRSNEDIQFKKERYVFWDGKWYTPSSMVKLLIAGRIREVKKEIAENETDPKIEEAGRRRYEIKSFIQQYLVFNELVFKNTVPASFLKKFPPKKIHTVSGEKFSSFAYEITENKVVYFLVKNYSLINKELALKELEQQMAIYRLLISYYSGIPADEIKWEVIKFEDGRGAIAYGNGFYAVLDMKYHEGLYSLKTAFINK